MAGSKAKPSPKGKAAAGKAKQAKAKAAQTPRRKSTKQPDDFAAAKSEDEDKGALPSAPSAPSQASEAVSTREQSALLNSLKYQLHSKKSTPQHRQMAEAMLTEYQTATRERKWEILSDLKNRGLKNLQWYHETSEATVRQEGQKTGCQEGMLLGSKILELNGLSIRDLTPEEQATTLEDLLSESETLYGHNRNMVKHATDPLLHRYLYVWSTGKKTTEKHMKEDRMNSSAELPKGKLGLMLCDEEPAKAPEATESYKKFSSLMTQLKKKKMALSKCLDTFDELLLFLPQKGGDNAEVEERLEALQAAAKQARDKLNELRVAIANGSQVKKTEECGNLNLERETLLSACSAACNALSTELDLSKRFKVAV